MSTSTNPIITNELTSTNELLSLRLQQLVNDTEDIIEVLYPKGNAQNKREYTLLFNEYKSNQATYAPLVKYFVMNIFNASFKELPLTILITMGAETLLTHKPSTRLRISSMIVRLLEASGAFFITTKLNQEGFSERIIRPKVQLTQATVDFLSTKQRNLPSAEPTEAIKVKYAGHRKKITANNEHMLPITNKVNKVGYRISHRVWERFKVQLAQYRFTHKHVQLDMIQSGDSMLDKTLYFTHRFGSDNGRVYCDGDLFTLHGGALNYIYKFEDKRMLNERGLERLEDRIYELEAESKLSFKEEVELYSLQCDLLDHLQGLPVGCILHQDAKLSGLQHQATALRCKDSALYCGILSTLEDGYNHIKQSLSNKAKLSRDMVKKAYNPYQYGAGADTTIKAVQEAGGDLDFKEWDMAYQSAFPSAYKLREFLLMISKEYKSEVYNYTSPSGFNCTITALGNEDTIIVTNYGKIEYSRKEVDAKHMGVKLVAGFSHMLDASSVHTIIERATYDLHVVHDSFGSHPNDADDVEANYVDSLREHLAMPILKKFVTEVITNRTGSSLIANLWEADVSALMENTLTPSDIVKGLY